MSRTKLLAELNFVLDTVAPAWYNPKWKEVTQMNERIKKIIEELGLKKVDFANRLHISQPFASELCSGAKAPSDRTIGDICREFGVREAWLRTGEGEMFVQDTQSEQVAAFLADLTKDDSDTFKKRFVEMLADLSPGDWELLERMAEKLTKKKEESP
jgi:transcriptional regulator with XRE-family HTH domain